MSVKLGNTSLSDGRKYILFPEQYTPEASTLTFSPYFYDQINTIKILRNNLPSSYTIVYKLHPAMDYKRKQRAVKALSSIPGVIVSRDNNYELIKRVDAIITLTSTMGWEGILFDTPVFTLGNVFYNHYKYTYVSSIRDIGENISSQINTWEEIIKTKEYIDEKYAFVYASLESLYSGNLNSHKDKTISSTENIETIVKSIHQYINDIS